MNQQVSTAGILVTALAAATILAACSRGFGGGADAPTTRATAESGDFYAGPALWDDPQNAPHPMFNWPTISHPPVPATGKTLPRFWAPPPPRALPANISKLSHVGRSEDVSRGGGLAIFGSLAVVPGFGEHSSLVDLSDPLSPQRVGNFFGPDGRAATIGYAYGQAGHQATEAANIGSDRGAAIIAYPSGRLVTVIATSGEIEVWDITDVENPRELPPLAVESSHKVGVVPGTPIVYNAGTRGGGSNSNLTGGTDHTEIFDLSDPDNPEFVQNFPNGYSCHHIFFWNNVEQNKFRAVCAGVQVTQIWDTADPRNPKIISTIPVHHGVAELPGVAVSPLVFSHSAGLNRDGTVLYVGDEAGGGSIPPGCVVSVPTPAGDVSTPIGAIWFYDISDETRPLLQGWYSAAINPVNNLGGTCTAHHGRLVPDPERDLLAMAFYGNGVLLIDFTNPTVPKAVSQFVDASNTWEAWYHQGYLITGDLSRGLDVLTLD